MLKLIRAVYIWTLFFLLTFVHFTWSFCAHLRQHFAGRDDRGRAVHRVAVRWARSVFFVAPWWKITVTGGENLPGDGVAYVIVGNHQSNADVLAMYYLGVQFRWLSKASVFRLPMIGPAMRWAGYVPVKRGDRSSHSQALAKSAEILKNGISMFFFPEGTRSRDGMVAPFKVGAFKLAVETGVPILPVTICGAGELLPKGSLIPNNGQVRIHVHPPTALAPNESLEGCALRIRELIVKTLMQTSPHPEESYSTTALS